MSPPKDQNRGNTIPGAGTESLTAIAGGDLGPLETMISRLHKIAVREIQDMDVEPPPAVR